MSSPGVANSDPTSQWCLDLIMIYYWKLIEHFVRFATFVTQQSLMEQLQDMLVIHRHITAELVKSFHHSFLAWRHTEH